VSQVNDPVFICSVCKRGGGETVQEAGWASRTVWTGAENLTPLHAATEEKW